MVPALTSAGGQLVPLGDGWSSQVYRCLTATAAPTGAVLKMAREIPGFTTADDRRQLALAWQREVAALTAVRSVPGAARLLASSPDSDNPPWLLLAEAPGESAEKVVATCGPLAMPAVTAIAKSLASTLSAIHRAGWLHLDVNPRNVLISPGVVTLIDFGAAQAIGAPSLWDWPLGRHRFMAPEHLGGRWENPRYGRLGTPADVHQLACLLLFLLTGREPLEPCREDEDYRHAYLDRLAAGASRPGWAKAAEFFRESPAADGIPLPAFAAALEPVPERRFTLSQFIAALEDR